ncbi:TetR/AcrR family transcriptional regulator [Nocardioides sp. KR10-350]|uniref:TetR/AcrR family transcriptional regulator n=1 Tax=Nocardioides cheoyonin TaxID=3156615 RepID=UPI0032B404D9
MSGSRQARPPATADGSVAPDGSRARLRAAAVAAFAERGFHGTTTRDIATAAGMSPAALYVHHRSKEELLHELSLAGHQATIDLIKEALDSSESPTEQLRALVHSFAVHHARGHTSARVVNYELASLSPEHLAGILALRHEIDTLVRGVVEAGVAAGEFDVPNPRLAATALLSLGIDLARWYRDDGGWSPEDVADGYAEIALRIVGVPR